MKMFVLLTMLFGSSQIFAFATKAELKKAIDASDLQEIYKVGMTDYQPSGNVVEFEFMGTIGEDSYFQTIRINKGPKPTVSDKFKADKVSID